jgi:N-acetylglucosamine-6-phosphate deacetylase
MSEEDEKRIEETFPIDPTDPDTEGLPTINAHRRDGAKHECEYWQSKLKERDELLAEMAEYIKTFTIAPHEEILKIRDMLTKYENLKAK